uniref:Sodium channel modifier 1 acidic C-terminal domain-containing protein n=1 Tax=Varanus komodoensis TaxID=61221 RepID=A0A8D2KQZ3_VARKO
PCIVWNREAKGSTDPSPARTPSGFRDAEEAALSEPWNSAPVGEDRAVGVESAHPASLPRPTDVKAESQEESALGKKQRRKRKAPPGAATPSGPDHLTPEKRQALEHYLRLKSSGWVQDGSGKWVKDENVEFDSDEEEPPALTLS